MGTEGQPWECVPALRRKPPRARLGVPSGRRRPNWISLPSTTTATLAAFPWRSSHPPRICSFHRLKAGRGERSENSHVQCYKQITKIDINRLPKCPCTQTPGSHTAQESENSPNCTGIDADLQEVLWPAGLGK